MPFIKAVDTYIEPDDLYTKRGYDWKMRLQLSGSLWDKSELIVPAMSVESRRDHIFSIGSFGIKANVKSNGKTDATADTDVGGYLRCRLSIGQYCYGKFQSTTKWWNTETDLVERENIYFDILLRDKSMPNDNASSVSVFQKLESIPLYGKGVEGYMIPVTSPIHGKIKFEIIHYCRRTSTATGFRNVSDPIELDIQFAKKDTELQDEKNTYKKDINATMLEEYEINSNLCTIRDNNPFTDHSVMTSTGIYLGEVLIEDGQQGEEAIIEDNTMQRAYDLYRLPRKLLTINVRYDKTKTYTPNQRITYQNKNYAILSADYNWRDSEVKLTLIEIV